MKKSVFTLLIIFALSVTSVMSFAGVNEGFRQGIKLELDGGLYTLAGAPLGDGTNEVPGHYWVIAGKNKLVGKHYNSSAPIVGGRNKFWSSNAPDGEFLYNVKGIIDDRNDENDAKYQAKGYVHIHELVTVADGTEHPTKVLYLKHTARTSFTLDGGPHPGMMPPHDVTPGVDYNFMPNY